MEVTCFYCPATVTVAPQVMHRRETAYQAMRSVGWLLGVRHEGVVVNFDPICHECGRGVVKGMIEKSGGVIAPQARMEMESLYPELFGEQVLN